MCSEKVEGGKASHDRAKDDENRSRALCEGHVDQPRRNHGHNCGEYAIGPPKRHTHECKDPISGIKRESTCFCVTEPTQPFAADTDESDMCRFRAGIR